MGLPPVNRVRKKKVLISIISIFYSLNMVKRSLDNHLMGSRKTIRPLLVDQAMIRHESRLNEIAKTTFTTTHQKVLLNLLHLATSHYAIVRIRAQETIQRMISYHAYSYKILLDPLIQLLSSDNDEEKVSHEAFKGQSVPFFFMKKRITIFL